MVRFIAAVVLFSACATGAQVLRVDIDAAPGGNGSSWAQAFDSLHDALTVATPGTQVWVAEGDYSPEFPATQEATFAIPSGVGVYGGFNGTESVLIARNPALNVTRLRGGINLPYNVVTIVAPGTNTVLDGFTILEGMATTQGAGRVSRGGGIYALNAAPTLRDLKIRQCQSRTPGAAIYLGGITGGASALVDRCIIEDNFGEYAVSISVPATIRDTDFLANGAGGLWLDGSEANLFQLVLRCEFRDHPPQNALSALLMNHTAPSAIAQIDGSLFDSNQGLRAGAVYILGAGDHEIRNSIFRNNSVTIANISAGAMYFDMDSAADSVLIENSLMIGNFTPGEGGAIGKVGPETLRIVSSTIAGNTAQVGSGIDLAGGVLDMDNTIIYNNIGTFFDQRRSVHITGGTASADRCIIEYRGAGPGLPIIAGQNTTTLSPLFVDADGPDNTFGTPDDNVRLMPGSPAIDAGNGLLLSPFVNFDIYGQNRFRDDTGTPDTGVSNGLPEIVDIGAAEFQGTTPSDCPADTNGDGMLSPADFNGWIIAFNNNAPECDQNGDGACTPADFNGWILNYNAGC